MKQWGKEATPPSSDDHDLLVIEGETNIREGDFIDDEEDNKHIESSQMDKIVT